MDAGRGYYQMLKPLENFKEREEIKVGDLLQVINEKDSSYKNIVVVIGFEGRASPCFYNVTRPHVPLYMNSYNYKSFGRLLPNAKTTKIR